MTVKGFANADTALSKSKSPKQTTHICHKYVCISTISCARVTNLHDLCVVDNSVLGPRRVVAKERHTFANQPPRKEAAATGHHHAATFRATLNGYQHMNNVNIGILMMMIVVTFVCAVFVPCAVRFFQF